MLVEGSGVLHVQTPSRVLPCTPGCVCTHINEDRQEEPSGGRPLAGARDLDSRLQSFRGHHEREGVFLHVQGLELLDP